MTSSERRQCERSTSKLEGKAPPHCRQHRLQGFHLLFLRMTYEKLKTDVMRWKEEHRAITESRPQKDWKLSSLQHELEQMKSTRDSYQAEVGTDLLSQLSVNEQGEVDRLNDKIQDLTRRAKEAYRRRMRLESEKSQLETQLYHNLFRKREQLERDLNEVSETDLNEKFRDAEEELTSVEQRIKDFQVRGLNGGETPPRNKLSISFASFSGQSGCGGRPAWQHGFGAAPTGAEVGGTQTGREGIHGTHAGRPTCSGEDADETEPAAEKGKRPEDEHFR